MLVRQPARFERFLTEGSSTRPWLMSLADANGEEASYVVKVFKERTVMQGFPIAKEALANSIAPAFELNVPPACLVKFDSEFIQKGLEKSVGDSLADKHKGFHFATEYKSGYTIQQPSFYGKKLASHNLAGIYAFDALMQNIDRGGMRNKPNLLLRDEDHLLIDHEQCLIFTDGANYDFDSFLKKLEAYDCGYNFRKHLLYPILKGKAVVDRRSMFDEFEQQLYDFKPQPHLNLIAELAEDYDIHMGNYTALGKYLCWLPQNAGKFRQMLVNSLA